jgi:hypothetical protein
MRKRIRTLSRKKHSNFVVAIYHSRGGIHMYQLINCAIHVNLMYMNERKQRFCIEQINMEFIITIL